jgi:midasin (ATPase involved in ribosome maturation)
MKSASRTILASLKELHPDVTVFRRKVIDTLAAKHGFVVKEYIDLFADAYRVHKGTYDYTSLLRSTTSTTVSQVVPMTPAPTTMKLATSVNSIVNTDAYIPQSDPTYIRWGEFSDIMTVIKSGSFYPIFIAGLSGNGKTMMVEQACAAADREYIRVQISPETDEDDLIGGFRLLNGETVFAKGPVIKAMERGAILLIDEIDRSSNKIMCLQGVLEGKPIMIKKTGEVILPSPGFNVIATANTKGKGSEDGRFVAATIIDEAFLERFVCTIEQTYPPLATERKIVVKHMEKYNAVDEEFAERLTTWSEVIRKTFADGGVDEVISTRRLCHIAHTFSIFRDRLKSIDMCISRFDDDTKIAFADLYSKIDASVNPVSETAPVAAVPPPEPPF